MSHTPLPWMERTRTIIQFEDDPLHSEECIELANEEDITVCYVPFSADGVACEEGEDNAAFILRAVNMHEELVDLVRRLVEWDVFGKDFGEVVKISRRAMELLAKVEGR